MSQFTLRRVFQAFPLIGSFLDNMGDSVYIVDDESRILFINKAVEKTEGLQKEQAEGKTIKEIYHFKRSPLLHVLKYGEPVKEFSYSYVVNGKEVCQLCKAFPLIYKGELIGAYAIQRDVTSYKNILEENILLQEKLGASGELYASGGKPSPFDRLIGRHPLFVECIDIAASAAQSDSSVLLNGSTGSGKEMFARCIHDAGPRKTKPFLAVNCAAIPENLLESILFGTSKGAFTGAVEKIGLFEQADGGTLFLDEINSMPLSSQAKLLRVLEEKEVRHLGSQEQIKTNVRIISSTNVNPREAIRLHQIREDLFYRLGVVNITIPDISKRKSDIFMLTDYFITQYNEKFNRRVTGISRGARDFFLAYEWPGNVRQLKHCIESAMNFIGEEELVISKRHLPQYMLSDANPVQHQDFSGRFNGSDELGEDATSDLFADVENRQKQLIISALLDSGGNVTKASKNMGISRQAMIYRMKKYGIKK